MLPTLPLPIRRGPVRSRAENRRLRGSARAWICFGAGLFATAEITLALLAGRFFDWGRAEALLFFAFRPWLLLIAAMRVGDWDWPSRYAFYVVALLTAGSSESFLLIAVGATNPWPEMVRGMAAGSILALVFDLVIRSGRRLAGRTGRLAAALFLALILVLPRSLAWFDDIVLGPTSSEMGMKPRVIVMTTLPIVWGEGGAFDPEARPAASWESLSKEFELIPIESIQEQGLAGERLLLIAQPRQLSPTELVLLDEWVRAGGHALVMADPALNWPSRLPPGDVRRPTSINMLTPLLDHWGIGFGPLIAEDRTVLLAGRRLRILGTSSLNSRNPACHDVVFFLVECRIGRGRAIVVADVDLLHDSTSLAPGMPAGRAFRLSDSVEAVADWLDRLAGLNRPRIAGDVQWASGQAGRGAALLVAFIPILLLLGLALALRRMSRYSPTYPQGIE